MEHNSAKLMKLLIKDGFALVSVKGSHHKFRKDATTLILPHPKKDIALGTVRAIYKQAGWL